MAAAFECPRCGAEVPADRLACPECTREGSSVMFSPFAGAEQSQSSIFLIPNDPSIAVTFSAPRTREQTRLLTWLAVGLLVASFTTGILHSMFYMRVGNRVSELLPRDTLAYVLVRRPGELREAFQNLELWTNTRPVRAAIRSDESELVSQFLLDLGINGHVFGLMQNGVTQAHIALMPGASLEAPIEALAFFEFVDPEAQVTVRERLAPFFEQGGREGGKVFQVRRLSDTTVTFAETDTMLVLGIGSTAGIRSVLGNLEAGPTRSLHDVPAFRTAWRARPPDSDAFVYGSEQAALAYLATRKQPRWHRMSRVLASLLAREAEPQGHGLSIDLALRGGSETGVLAFHAPEGHLDTLRGQLGRGAGGLLSAVPVTAEFAFSMAVNDANGLFDAGRGPILEGLSALDIVDVGPPPYTWLNQLQAESGVNFVGDLLTYLGREAGFALVPSEQSLDWLFLAELRTEKQALDRISKLVTEYVSSTAGGTGSKVTLDDTGIYRAMRPEASSDRQVALCWTVASSTLLLSENCAVVQAARKASLGSQGLDDLPSVRVRLALLDDNDAVALVIRPRPLLERVLGRLPAFSPFAREHVVVAGVRIDEEHLEVVGNLSLLSTSYVAMDRGARQEQDATTCQDFIAAACAGLSDAQCDQFKAKVGTSSATACRTGLRAFKTLQTASSAP